MRQTVAQDTKKKLSNFYIPVVTALLVVTLIQLFSEFHHVQMTSSFNAASKLEYYSHDTVVSTEDRKPTQSSSNMSKIKVLSDPNDVWWRGRDMTVRKTNASSSDMTYAGAKHPNGTWGMIVNPSTSRLEPFNRTLLQFHDFICPPTKIGIEGEGGNQVLQKIKGGVEKSKEFLFKAFSHSLDNATARAKPSKILCMIYTAHFPPSYDNQNLRAQAQTWGAQCDGFIAASNFTDHSIGSIDLMHNGPETYSNMWQKVRSMWAYVYKHYREEYDFFHICGDDVYVVVDNLRSYLDGPEVLRLENGFQDDFAQIFPRDWSPQDGPRPLLLATPMLHKRMIVIAGGPGYTMNRAAVKKLYDQLPRFFPDAQDSREDVFIASAIHESCVMSNTRDSKQSKRYGGSANSMFQFKGVGPDSPRAFSQRFNLPYPPHGLDGVSEQFVSFHLKDDISMLLSLNRTIADQMYRYHAFFNEWCGHR